jgi:hypothetical protein
VVIHSVNFRTNDVAADTNGIVCISGFSDGNGFSTAPSFGSAIGMLTAKYNSNGTLIWARVEEGSANANSVDIDNKGDVYVGGSFIGDSATGLQIIGTDTLFNPESAQHNGKLILVKYDRNGNELWAITSSTSDFSWINDVHIDAFGNCLVAGGYHRDSLTFGHHTIHRYGFYEGFLAKVNSSGDVLWLKNIGSPNDDYTTSCSSDALGNVFLSGYFNTTVHADLLSFTSFGMFDGYVIKFDSSGSAIWLRNIGGANDERANKVTVDAAGNAYVGGYFHSYILYADTMNLWQYSGTPPCNDIFLLKFDGNGNGIWSRRAGGTNCDELLSQSTDRSGHTFIAGFFSDLQTYIGSDTLNGIAGPDVFYARYNEDGTEIWAKALSGTSMELPRSIDADNHGNIYCVGLFQSRSIDFDNISCQNTGAFGNNDAYFSKMSDMTTFLPFERINNLVSIFPNPSLDLIRFNGLIRGVTYKIAVLNVSGQIVMQGTINMNEYNVSNLVSGVYSVIITDPVGNADVIRFVKIEK